MSSFYPLPCKLPIAKPWLEGWLYRKSVTLNRASGAVTDYQMKLLVGESAGAIGEDVDCNGHCLANFNDLRFTTSDGETLLDYWIESVTGSSPNGLATVWIEFDSIGTETTTFYMYYGKADAPVVSSGENTFIFFDDFERGNDGDEVGNNWVEYEGTVEISTEQAKSGTRSMKLEGTASYPRIRRTITANDNIGIRFHIYRPTSETVWIGHGDGTNLLNVSLNSNTIIYVYSTTWVDSGLTIPNNTWTVIEFNDFQWVSKLVDVFSNANKADGMTMQVNSGNTNLFAIIGDAYYNGYIDNFIVRNFRTVEPVWGSWGEEET